MQCEHQKPLLWSWELGQRDFGWIEGGCSPELSHEAVWVTKLLLLWNRSVLAEVGSSGPGEPQHFCAGNPDLDPSSSYLGSRAAEVTLQRNIIPSSSVLKILS